MSGPEVKTPDSAATGQASGQNKTGSSILIEGEVTDKQVRTMIATAALAGWEVHEMADGGFVVARWNLTRAVPDARALRGFLRVLGVMT